MAKVSVIIPCYNQGQFINEAIDSVLKQTFKDFEIIIVNDGSTDADTVNILNSLDEKYVLIHTKNQGLASARNTGIHLSKGDYILPLDADDKIAPKYLEEAVKVLDLNKKVKVVYSKAAFFGKVQGEWVLPDYSWERMLYQNIIFCSALFRRSDFDKTIGYNSNMKYGWEDWDLWLSILKDGGGVYKLENVMFFYRKHSSSMVENINKDKCVRTYLEQQLIINHCEVYLQHYPDPLTLLRELNHLRKEQQQFEKYKADIYGSLSYIIGKAILKPFKWLRRS
jgi:glycosyltransferase involved in cell wall biosynthesis